MSQTIDAAVAALNAKLDGAGFSGTAKFEIGDKGSLIIDENGARAGDDEADVTLIADTEVFEGILSGDVNPTTAFMTGKLKIEGDMGAAMRLGQVLS